MIRILYILANFLFLIDAVAVLRREDLILDNVDERDSHLTPEDFRESKRLLEVDLRTAGIDTSIDPLLKANKFEGDIANLNKTSIRAYMENSNSFARSAIRDTWRRWPNAEIPYVISSRYGSYSKRIIAKAMDEYHRKTCIRFVPRDENRHRDYIYIFPDDGCYSLVGRTGGRQPLSLDSGCMQTGTVQHELMHAAGFFHEQSRTDRDDYIDIVISNVSPDALDQFEKYSLRTITLLDIPYDYGSIMHYGAYAFSKNGQRTIRAKKSGADRMGQREGFSDMDLKKLNSLYQCSQESVGSSSGDVVISTTTSRPLLTEAKCENQKWQCFFWSKLGYCKSYADYMRNYCPKSCDMCGSQRESSDQSSQSVATTAAPANGASQCVDRDSHCESWARKNYCTKSGFSVFTKSTCPLSCGVCVQAAPPSMASMADDE